MRRMLTPAYDADMTHDAFASMRHMRMGVIGGARTRRPGGAPMPTAPAEPQFSRRLRFFGGAYRLCAFFLMRARKPSRKPIAITQAPAAKTPSMTTRTSVYPSIVGPFNESVTNMHTACQARRRARQGLDARFVTVRHSFGLDPTEEMAKTRRGVRTWRARLYLVH